MLFEHLRVRFTIVVLLRSNFRSIKIFVRRCISKILLNSAIAYSGYDSPFLSSGKILLVEILTVFPNISSCGVNFVPSWTLVLCFHRIYNVLILVVFFGPLFV